MHSGQLLVNFKSVDFFLKINSETCQKRKQLSPVVLSRIPFQKSIPLFVPTPIWLTILVFNSITAIHSAYKAWKSYTVMHIKMADLQEHVMGRIILRGGHVLY